LSIFNPSPADPYLPAEGRLGQIQPFDRGSDDGSSGSTAAV